MFGRFPFRYNRTALAVEGAVHKPSPAPSILKAQTRPTLEAIAPSAVIPKTLIPESLAETGASFAGAGAGTGAKDA